MLYSNQLCVQYHIVYHPPSRGHNKYDGKFISRAPNIYSTPIARVICGWDVQSVCVPLWRQSAAHLVDRNVTRNDLQIRIECYNFEEHISIRPAANTILMDDDTLVVNGSLV